MPEQSSLNLPAESKATGPVECLGQTFPSEEARREHFLALLAEKLKDPEFRKIEGFPIGKDEDILALSDPPYYTACPNPWLADFVKCYGTPYDPKKPYHREPPTTDLEESRNNPFVNAHSYVTKTPHQAIMRLIAHFTEPGAIILDGFSGTGMTGVAAQELNKDSSEIALSIKTIAPHTVFGPRHVILSDLSVAGSYIAKNLNGPIENEFFGEVANINRFLREDIYWLFQTKHNDNINGNIIAVIWSDHFSCPECGNEIDFWDAAVDLEHGKIVETIICPHCEAESPKSRLEKRWKTGYDIAIGQTIETISCEPKIIIYEVGSKRYQKTPDIDDLRLIDKSKSLIGPWFPKNFVPPGYNTDQPRKSHGLNYVHQYFTARNLYALSMAWSLAECTRTKFMLTSLMFKSSVFCAPLMSNFFAEISGKPRGGWIGKERTGTLYCPAIHSEVMLPQQINTRSKSVELTAFNGRSKVFISTQSSAKFPIANDSVDYIFTDPPFGANRMYSEINFLWESWLKIITNEKDEAIENPTRKKDLFFYKSIMLCIFREYYRVLKPGRWLSVQFSNTQAVVWNTLQAILSEAGFVVAAVGAMHKQQGSIEAYTSAVAVRQDLVIHAYKPNGGLEERFAKAGENPEGAWEFVKTHLRNLPVVKARAGQLEPILERDPRILYDRMVAFYVGHSVPVPLSSAEFQAGLAERFPERDSMFFLSEQVAEYDKKRAVMDASDPGELFISDERTAIAWLRRFLKDRPSVQADIYPQFMPLYDRSKGYKKAEAMPDIRALLDQNFLRYDGTGEVPSQIHAYLSTQFKELRNLPKDHPQLRAKAKDRWYVPDPKNLIQVEELRNKRLLEEFWNYLPDGYRPAVLSAGQGESLPGLAQPRPKVPRSKKLKEVRTEAVRVGFKHCYKAKDYGTILAVAEMLPESILNEDEQLQMLYDNAAMRSGAES